MAVLAALLLTNSAVGSASAQQAPTVAAIPAAPTAASPLTAIQQLIDRSHAELALQELDKLAADKSPPAGMERVRGLAFYSEDDLQPAEQAFAAALTRDPADIVSTQMRGITLYRLGRPTEAIPLLEAVAAQQMSKQNQAAAQQASGPADPQYVLALCYLDTRRYDDARHAFATQYGFAQDSAPAYLLAARMLLRREYIPIAQQFAHKALELSPQLPLAHRLLGEAELAGNHLDEAIKEFQTERQLNPLDAVTYDRLGDAYSRQGDYETARKALQESVILDPNSTGPFILLGKVLLKQQDVFGASKYLEHARDMDPQNFLTHSLLGQAYRQMGRPEDGKAEQEMAQKLQAATEPKYQDAH